MTNSPLFDTRSPRCGKSLLTPELKKRFGQSTSDKITGYSCDMMIIDDVIEEQYGQPIFLAPTSDGTDPMQKLLDDYKVWYDKKVAEMLSIPKSATKAGVANTTELQSKLAAKKLDEELYAKFGIRDANSEQELQKTWGRNY
jgi:hypothetical protein